MRPALERARRCLGPALALTLLAGACDDAAPACRAGTLLLTYHFEGPALQADELTSLITIGQDMMTDTRPHIPGETQIVVEVRFPAGYPQGQRLTVEVTARRGGTLVGVGQAAATLAPGCQALDLRVGNAAVDLQSTDTARPRDTAAPLDLPPADMSMTAMDAATAVDRAMMPGDGASPVDAAMTLGDLAMAADLGELDLVPPADLALPAPDVAMTPLDLAAPALDLGLVDDLAAPQD